MASQPGPEDLRERVTNLERRLSVLEALLSELGRLNGSGGLGLPEPIAYALARERSAVLYNEKFFSLLDAGEACIRYTAALSLALVEDANERGALTASLKGQAVALGTWASVTRNCLASLQKERSGAGAALRRSLLETLLKPNGKPSPASRFVLSELVELRNVERGHSSARQDGVYEELYRRYETSVHDAFASLSFLRFPMVRIEDIDIAGTYMRYSLRVLVGPSPIGRIQHMLSLVRLPKGQTCVWDGVETLVGLGGLVTYMTCQVCGLEHTFFVDQATSRETRYYSYTGNHRFDAPPLGWAMSSASSEASEPPEGSSS